jgi:RNA polymerase sigma factor (sigma-70 family)
MSTRKQPDRPMSDAERVTQWLGKDYSPIPRDEADRLAREVVRDRIRLRHSALRLSREEYAQDLASNSDDATNELRLWALDVLAQQSPSSTDIDLIAEADLDVDPAIRCVDLGSIPSVGRSVVAWRGLVATIAFQDFRGDLARCKAIDMYDLLQEGAEALRSAVMRFNPDKFAFSTFATRCIRNHLIKVIERQSGPVRLGIDHSKGAKIRVSAYATTCRGSVPQINGADAICVMSENNEQGNQGEIETFVHENIEQVLTDNAIGHTIDEQLSSLPLQERRAVRAHFVDGMTFKEIGRQWISTSGAPYPITGEAARKYCKAGVDRIRRALIPYMDRVQARA